MNIDQVLRNPNTQVFAPARHIDFKNIKIFNIIPVKHQEVIKKSNGLTIYYGYYRLFGFCRDDYLDIVRWNDKETWKFAWGEKLLDFLCFGESAWGDQYAYRFNELNEHTEPKIYILNNATMEADILADCFEDFFSWVFP